MSLLTVKNMHIIEVKNNNEFSDTKENYLTKNNYAVKSLLFLLCKYFWYTDSQLFESHYFIYVLYTI